MSKIPAIPSSRNQDPAHVMNFPSLNLGHAPCSKTQFNIVDLDIYVYGLEEIKGSNRPVAAIVRFNYGLVLITDHFSRLGQQCCTDGEHVPCALWRDQEAECRGSVHLEARCHCSDFGEESERTR